MEEAGLSAFIEEEISYEGKSVSSTLVRSYLSEGEVGSAREILGAPYFISGKVESGNKVGKTLGFPTINVPFGEGQINLRRGVYLTGVKIGEKIDFRRFEILHKEEGQSFGYYIHMGGKVSALVLLAQDNAEIAHDLAIHVSANKALYLTKADIPAEELARETAVQIEIVKNDPKLAGKPEAALAKIVEGKVNKNFVDSVLAEQPYLMEETLTVGKYLAQHNLSIVKFVRYAVGEGIERRQDNFVEEVMNQAK
jgi:translation elongation factor Ts